LRPLLYQSPLHTLTLWGGGRVVASPTELPARLKISYNIFIINKTKVVKEKFF